MANAVIRNEDIVDGAITEAKIADATFTYNHTSLPFNAIATNGSTFTITSTFPAFDLDPFGPVLITIPQIQDSTTEKVRLVAFYNFTCIQGVAIRVQAIITDSLANPIAIGPYVDAGVYGTLPGSPAFVAKRAMVSAEVVNNAQYNIRPFASKITTSGASHQIQYRSTQILAFKA